MMLIEITNRINNKFGTRLTAVVFFQYPTIKDLLSFLEKNNRKLFERYFFGTQESLE